MSFNFRRSGVAALLARVGERPIEVLVNNAGFGSYGPFAKTDPEREADEVAVDVSAVIALARAFLPGMIARGSGGILNVASAFQILPGPILGATRGSAEAGHYDDPRTRNPDRKAHGKLDQL